MRPESEAGPQMIASPDQMSKIINSHIEKQLLEKGSGGLTSVSEMKGLIDQAVKQMYNADKN